MAASTRLEEVAYHRAELENAKRENETLRRRIKKLERNLSEHREQDTTAQVANLAIS